MKKKCGRIKGAGPWDYQKVEAKGAGPRFHLFRKDIEQMHMALGLPGYDEHDDKRYVMALLSTILGGNMSSRLFVKRQNVLNWRRLPAN